MTHCSVGEAAKALRCKPKVVSTYFYLHDLPGFECPIVGNRRLIALEALPVLREELAKRGKLPAAAETIEGGA
jgi:hypothetical protein